MAQDINSLLTGLSTSLNKYLELGVKTQLETEKEDRKFTKEIAGKKTLAEYENQLSMSRDLMKLALEEEAKGKDYTPGNVVGELTGNPAFAKVERFANKDVFDFYQKMKELELKAKTTKPGKIPVGLLDQEAQIIATESLFKQAQDLFFEKDKDGNIIGTKSKQGLGGGLRKGLSDITGGLLGTEDERQYEEFLDGIVGNFARVISAEKGALREEDIQRARSLFPRLREPLKVQLKKLSIIQDTLKQRKKTLYDMQEKAKATPSTGLDDVSNEELIQMYLQMKNQGQ